MRSTLCAATLGLALACHAQTPASAPAAAPAAEAPQQRGGEPKVQRLVTEDDRVRIEELRVRGLTRKVTVQPKLPGVPAYQIGPTGDARDVPPDRRTEGGTLWQLFSF